MRLMRWSMAPRIAPGAPARLHETDRFVAGSTPTIAAVHDQGGAGDEVITRELGFAVGLLRSRALSAVELLEACQARIAARNGGAPTFDGAPGAINAWTRLYPERAAELARAADARLATEAEAAPLTCGIPFALKDLFAVA